MAKVMKTESQGHKAEGSAAYSQEEGLQVAHGTVSKAGRFCRCEEHLCYSGFFYRLIVQQTIPTGGNLAGASHLPRFPRQFPRVLCRVQAASSHSESRSCDFCPSPAACLLHWAVFSSPGPCPVRDWETVSKYGRNRTCHLGSCLCCRVTVTLSQFLPPPPLPQRYSCVCLFVCVYCIPCIPESGRQRGGQGSAHRSRAVLVGQAPAGRLTLPQACMVTILCPQLGVPFWGGQSCPFPSSLRLSTCHSQAMFLR